VKCSSQKCTLWLSFPTFGHQTGMIDVTVCLLHWERGISEGGLGDHLRGMTFHGRNGVLRGILNDETYLYRLWKLW
jgi:hypothetical protein